MSVQRVAIVDQGSNSTRLFLCEGLAPDGPHGERLTTVTALRQGALADGTVSDQALDRLRACFDEYARRIDMFVPDQVVVIGTSAVRDAPNRMQVAGLVREALHADLTVVTGAQEAELAYVGARLGVDGAGPVTVMDIGGGSTELVRGGPDGPTSAVSMDIGGVRHSELHLLDDPPSSQQVDALVDEVRATAGAVFDVIGRGVPLVGVAGTMTSLAAIAIGVYDPSRVHRSTLTAAQVRQMLDRLAALDVAARRSVPGLHPDRAPAIVAGAAIAVGVMEVCGVDTVTVSERDLLDGAVLRLTDLGR